MLGRKPVKKPAAGRQRPSRLSADKPAAYAYYSRRSEQLLNTGRLIARSETAAKTKQLTRYWRQRFGLAVLLIAALACFGYISTVTPSPNIQINQMAGSAAVLRDLSVYEQSAQTIMESSLLNRNKVTFSTASVSRQLLQQYPELAQVSVALPLISHKATVKLTPATPLLLMATTNGSYALDANGVALVTGAQLAALSSLNLPLVTDESNLKFTLRSQALPASQVQFIATVHAQLVARKFPLTTLTLPAGTSELHIRFDGQPYYAKFNLANSSAGQQAGTLIAVYERLQQQGIVPAEYIDVRVDGRAYYR